MVKKKSTDDHGVADIRKLDINSATHKKIHWYQKNRLYNFMRYSHILFLFTNIEENE